MFYLKTVILTHPTSNALSDLCWKLFPLFVCSKFKIFVLLKCIQNLGYWCIKNKPRVFFIFVLIIKVSKSTLSNGRARRDDLMRGFLCHPVFFICLVLQVILFKTGRLRRKYYLLSFLLSFLFFFFYHSQMTKERYFADFNVFLLIIICEKNLITILFYERNQLNFNNL